MMTAKYLIAALQGFDPNEEVSLVFHVEGYSTVVEEIGAVMSADGCPAINGVSFLRELERVKERTTQTTNSTTCKGGVQ